MHVISTQPRVIVAQGARTEGARPMAWQVLFERGLGAGALTLCYRGVSAARLHAVIRDGFDSEPTLAAGNAWAHARLVDAMADGPVLQVFRADRLPDDVSRALVGLIVFEEDGLHRDGVRTLLDSATKGWV